MNLQSITLPCVHPLPRRKLPIGIQSFAKLREENCYYVDKTAIAIQLIDSGTYYFLSHPRRFGKSLFLDTLREMFEGNQALFNDLAAENAWDWRKKYPVIRISFCDGVLRNRAELDQRISEILLDNQHRLGVSCTHQSLGGQFGELIALVHQKTSQRAVVLIDEYDKPILDNIDHSVAAIEMREGLKNLYSVLKGSDEHLKFVFLTGVSKFSKFSLFYGLMFQAGYLTIADVWQAPGQMEPTLKYPNLEVQAALNNSLLQSLTGGMAVPGPYLSKLYKLLMDANFDGLKNLFHAFYASIANDWYRKNEMSNFEGYYVSIFYSYFAALGLHIQLEDSTNQGRIDMTVLFKQQVFLFEFKVVELNPAGNALPQIKDKCYADKFKARGEPIHLIRAEFSKTSRNIVGFEVEMLQVQ